MNTRIDITLDGLRGLSHRIEHQKLEPTDWPVVGALAEGLINREEGKMDRMADLSVQSAEGLGKHIIFNIA